MARMTKSQTKKRVMEARQKIRLVFVHGNWDTAATDKLLLKLMDDLAKLERRLHGVN